MGFSKETLPQSYHIFQKRNFYMCFFCSSVLLNFKIDGIFFCSLSILLLDWQNKAKVAVKWFIFCKGWILCSVHDESILLYLLILFLHSFFGNPHSISLFPGGHVPMTNFTRVPTVVCICCFISFLLMPTNMALFICSSLGMLVKFSFWKGFVA